MTSNVVPARPSISTSTPLAKVTSVADALEHPELRERLHAALPRHMSPERMLRTFHLALQRTPDLAKADMRELLGALIGFAAIGIEPNTPLGHGWLIPFAKRQQIDGQWQTVGMQIQPIVGYKGYIDLARRTGSMISLHADVAYTGDDFDYCYGTDEFLRHRYGPRDDVLSPEFAYAVAKLDGGHQFEVMPWADVMRIRDGSQGYQQAKRKGGRTLEGSPWVAHLDAMARKTGVRRLAKMLPMSIEMSTAAMIDEMGDGRGARFGSMLDVSPREISGETLSGYVEDGDDGVMEVTAETIKDEPKPQQQAKARPAANTRTKPKEAEKSNPAASEPEQGEGPMGHADDPGPGGDDQPAASTEDDRPMFKVMGTGGSVYAVVDSEQLALENLSELLEAAMSVEDVDAIGRANAGLDLSEQSLEVLKGLADDKRDEFRANSVDPSGEAEPEPEPEEDGAPEVDLAALTVDAAKVKGADGSINSMAAAKALDDAAKNCATPADWAAFEQANEAVLNHLRTKSKSLAKSIDARIAKGKAG